MSIDNATADEWNKAYRATFPEVDPINLHNVDHAFDQATRVNIATLKDYIKQKQGFVEIPFEPGVFFPIKGYEGLYSISRTGQVISHANKSNHKETIVLKPSFDKDGYKRVTLQHNKKRKYFRVCRLVAETFIPNPENKPFVNHKDKDKTNDCVDNLEWTTEYENWKHSEDEQSNKEIAVIKLSLSGDYICEYKSLMDASRDTKINQGNITNCLKGRCKSVGGFRWIEK